MMSEREKIEARLREQFEEGLAAAIESRIAWDGITPADQIEAALRREFEIDLPAEITAHESASYMRAMLHTPTQGRV